MATENQKIKNKLLEGIEIHKANLHNAKATFLRKYGWDYCCNFPDSCWRWCKEVKGQTIALNLKEALSIESEIIEHGK